MSDRIDGMPTEDHASVQGNSHAASIEDKDARKILISLRPHRRRSVTRESGRGLEITAHAIESLVATEYMDVWPYSRESRLEAIELLKRANQEIYYSCPVIVPLGDRIMKLVDRLLRTTLPD